MPSHLHESMVEMVRRRPGMVAELLEILGQEVPAHGSVGLDPADLGDLVPTEYRADAVVVLRHEGRPALAVIVEIQLARDLDKRRTWPVYLTTLRARLKCPVMLLVVSPDAATAAWCAQPIDLGHPGFTLTPLVVGPGQVPVVDTVEEAVRSPELAVLSALAHGADPKHYGVLTALGNAFATLDGGLVSLYSALVQLALPVAARRMLEEPMFNLIEEHPSEAIRKVLQQGFAQGRTEGRTEGLTEGRTEGRTEGLTEGRAEGRAASVLAVLDARGITVSAKARARIVSCADDAQLDEWVRAAVTVSSAEELFAT